jgi:hypothetical protein
MGRKTSVKTSVKPASLGISRDYTTKNIQWGRKTSINAQMGGIKMYKTSIHEYF